MKPRWIVAATFALLLSAAAEAAEIKVLASGALREVWAELVPQFEKASGHKVVATFGATGPMAKRVADGESFDLVIMGQEGIDELVRLNKLVPGTRVGLAKSGVGVAVKAGAPKPDISSAEAVKKAVLAAKSLAFSAGASGVYLMRLFEKMGIADAVKAKTATVKSGEYVGNVVARGDAELGFQQVSELVHIKGIEYLGELPAEIQNVTVFTGGVPLNAKNPDGRKALSGFLSAPATTPVKKKHGLDPG